MKCRLKIKDINYNYHIISIFNYIQKHIYYFYYIKYIVVNSFVYVLYIFQTILSFLDTTVKYMFLLQHTSIATFK